MEAMSLITITEQVDKLIEDKTVLLERIHMSELNIGNLKSNIEVHLIIIDRLDKTVESLRDLAEATHTLISVHDTRLNSLDNQIQDSKIDNKALFIKLTSIESQIMMSTNDKANISEKLDRLADKLKESELDRKELNIAVAVLNTKIEDRLLSLENPEYVKKDLLRWLTDNWRVVGVVLIVAADLVVDISTHKLGYLFRLLIGSS